MNKKKKALLLITVSIFSMLNISEVKAFQPASHYALIQKVADDLPSSSKIKQAINKYPDVAAWGAVAPDLGYFQPSELGGYAPWADRFHYYKVGSFAKTQLKEALSSGDLRKIAFASGWVSHVSGDLACHGIYVNPEAGVYLENEDGRDLHKKLESNAEPYVWNSLGKQDSSIYNDKKLANVFSSVDSIPLDLINDASSKVYDTSPSVSEEKRWCNVLLTGLNTGIGYTYTEYNDSLSYLNINGRKDRLDNAFSTAENQCTKLLKLAEEGNYEKFSDRWNLDVGASESPISSLTAIVTTGTENGSGTDDDIYFGIELKTGDTKEWKLDKSSYNDFENGDKDEYYLYINDVDFSPSLVNRVWIQKKHIKYSVGEAWYLDSFKVDVNGVEAMSESPCKWIKGNSSEYFDTNWSHITNTTDPTF